MSEPNGANGNAKLIASILGAVAALGGGGALSHSSLGNKIDDIRTVVIELRAHEDANDRARNELTATAAALTGRVTVLENHDATQTEKLTELSRRLHELETKTK